MTSGHKHSFEITQTWATNHSTDIVALSSFLGKLKIEKKAATYEW